MDFDALQQGWAAQDHRLDRALRLHTDALRQLAFARSTTHIDRLRRGLWFGLAQDVLFVLLFGSFVADHIAEPRFLLPGLLLHVLAIAALVSTVRQLVLARGIDSAAPVVRAQQQIAELRRLRLATTKWILVLAPLLWTPLLVTALRGLLGVDLYATPLQGWLLANAIFGVACVPLLLWLARKLAARTAGSPLLQRLARDLTGVNLAAAQRELDAIAAFARD